MKRGEVVTVVVQGDYGMLRPAVVIESDLVASSDSVLVCLISSHPHGEGTLRRQGVSSTPETGLRLPSQIMVDKVLAVRRAKCGAPVGSLDQAAMRELTARLAVLIGVED